MFTLLMFTLETYIHIYIRKFCEIVFRPRDIWEKEGIFYLAAAVHNDFNNVLKN